MEQKTISLIVRWALRRSDERAPVIERQGGREVIEGPGVAFLKIDIERRGVRPPGEEGKKQVQRLREDRAVRRSAAPPIT